MTLKRERKIIISILKLKLVYLSPLSLKVLVYLRVEGHGPRDEVDPAHDVGEGVDGLVVEDGDPDKGLAHAVKGD